MLYCYHVAPEGLPSHHAVNIISYHFSFIGCSVKTLRMEFDTNKKVVKTSNIGAGNIGCIAPVTASIAHKIATARFVINVLDSYQFFSFIYHLIKDKRYGPAQNVGHRGI